MVILGLVAAIGALPTAAGASRLFDVDLDDRVDPVPPGAELVYEIEVENSFLLPAPDTVVSQTLPPGTTFVAAYRQPDWAEIPGEILPGEVRFHLGDEPSCGNVGLPPCRDIWSVLRVDEDVEPGTVLMSRVEVTSSNPEAYPPHVDSIYTSVGTAAIRTGRVTFARTAGRDRVSVEADLGRAGLPNPLLPAPPTIDPTTGVRVVVRDAGGFTALDLTLPGDAFKCSGTVARRCRLVDPRAWRPSGLDRLNFFLPMVFQQRNNAQVLLRTAALTLPDDFGPTVEITIESDGATFVDEAEFVPGPNRLAYRHRQTEP